jgi:hypothetical protein
MAEDQRKGWLADLKIGDKVFVAVHGIDHTIERREITKITPIGRIVCGAWEFNPQGRLIGKRGWHNPFLIESTKETADKWRHERLVVLIGDWARTKMPKEPLEILETVWRAIKAATPKEIP